MINTAKYEVQLRIDGTLIGNVRELAQNLKWVRRRTKAGVDEIDFAINDVLFQNWCLDRNTDINSLLKPLALDCRIIRDGVPVVGGFLATMPNYQPNGTSANLQLRFDGYLNYLAGVYMYPVGTQTGAMGTLVDNWIQLAESRATTAGKGFGLTTGTISAMNTVTYTFDNYKAIKDAITDRCDNVSGAGMFDVYFHTDRTYDIIKDSAFGDVITDYQINYPMQLNGQSATQIAANEVDGFASSIVGIGSGEVSPDADKNTAITSLQTDAAAVTEYGYAETILQDSSISRQTVLDINAATRLSNTANPIWQPTVQLIGRQVNPTPNGEKKIWIGDTVTINNSEDMTGMTNGTFRVNELAVDVSAAGGEIITPVLERVA